MSTSAVRVPSKLGSPWEYAQQTDDGDRAFASLVRVVEAKSDATIKTVDTKEHYLLAQFPSKVNLPRFVKFISIVFLALLFLVLGRLLYSQ